MMQSAFGTLIGSIALLLALPADAHHSQSMFDHDRMVTLSGTVREFQWTNPHCYIQVLVSTQEERRGTEEWSVEMGGPTHLVRSGWKPGTLKPGDKITVVIFPLRDGGKGGNYVSAIGPDGKALGTAP